MITGWNEWVAGRWIHDGSFALNFLGAPVATGEGYMVDAYNREYSRDLEPMKGGYTDNYYYQMIDGIRRFKGVAEPLTVSNPVSIMIDGDFDDWTDVAPEYRDTLGDTAHRAYPGWGNGGPYTNTTGRNDLLNMKVARDEINAYFYVETREAISSSTDASWMHLLIDIDQNHETGWEGYDYLLNHSVIDATTTTLKRNSGGNWNWTTINSGVDYRVTGNKMEMAVPLGDLAEDTTIHTLQGWWNLDDGAGLTAADSAVNPNHGTLNGLPSWVGGLFGQALSFDGIDDFVSVPIDVSETAYAVSLWFKTAGSDGGLYQVGGGGFDRLIYLAGGNLFVRVWNNELIATSGLNLSDNCWHHLVHTLGGAIGGQTLYVDGVPAAIGVKEVSDFDWQSEIRIGYAEDSVNPYFNGLIDEVRVFDDALSSGQVAQLFNGPQAAGPFAFDFHWSDNMGGSGDIAAFALNGDSAPNRRFNYRYDTETSIRACEQLFDDGLGQSMDLDGDCDLDLDDLDLIAAAWIDLYNWLNFSELVKDWLTSYQPTSLSAVTILNDCFEAGAGNWTGWSLVTTDAFSPAHAIECRDCALNLTSVDLDTSGAGSVVICFRYKMDNGITDSDDVFVQYYNGSSYDTVSELSLNDQGVWLYYTDTLENMGAEAQYFINNFRIQINGVGINVGSEYVVVDDVVIYAM